MSKEIKQNLFKFVTIRNPQLIDKKEEHPGFVFHPENYSIFSEVIADSTNLEELKEGIQEQSNEMQASAFKTRKEVAAVNENLYAFSAWLMRNKNNLSFQAIQDNLNSATLLDRDKKEDIVFWENLIYQTLEKKSVYVREALIQMLIADQFLKAFKDLSLVIRDGKFTKAQQEEFSRRACASVVISKELFADEVDSVPSKRKRLSETEEAVMLKALNVEAAKENLETYKKLEKELKKVESKYNKKSQKAYDTALANHNESVSKIIESTKPVLIEEVDPRTGVNTTIKTYPDLKLPEFTFEKEAAIDLKYLEGKLSQDSMSVFTEQELNIYDDFTEVYTAINTQIQSQNQTIANNESSNTGGTVVVGGVVTPVKGNQINLSPYCFFVSRLSAIGNPGLSMFLGTGYAGALASNASYTLENLNSGVKYTGTAVDNGTGLTGNTARLFFPITQAIDNNVPHRFSGTFTLDNGITLSFDVTSVGSKRYIKFNGCCDIVKDDNPSDTTDDVTTPEIFGVTSLGIADFRRVEQEVCCYVPGEVSRIENVMAREYKERATRTLNSIETTSEDTTEREVENLTDTTTTERNEMQSEVSAVINEDETEAYGANASVSGKAFGVTFGAGAYYDASSSSSTSNSNTQAQTYAQEVTERAMERVVKKVSSKRTSRILKEFEENNKHGFDNTKGDKHISGVYRWIDKVYKNTLINYGKRLMYEFAIPEPARFFKEALWKKFNNDELASDVVLPNKPTHPKDLSYSLKMVSAEDLTQGNYKEIAALYNAEVPAYPEQIKTLSKQEVIDVWGDSGRWARSGGFDIEIPEGYKAKSVKGYFDPINGNHSAAWNNMRAYIFIGGKKILVPGQTSYFPINETFTKPITGDLGVSLTSWDIGVYNFNLTIDCQLLDTVMDQWRNETFNAIMDAYNDRLREYNEAILANELGTSSNGEQLKFNPLLNRSLEKKELKRVAIELLIEQHRVSRNNYTAVNETTGLSTVKKGQALQNHASTVKFFEQAFDWDIMAYTFYPYFYANENDWKDLFQSQDAADPIFQAFLQSGMARTVIPVRPGFEDAVNWYMSTGEIWNGEGLITDQDNDLYVSIAEEMQTIEGEVEKSWETRLPTSLTVLQAGSIGLKVEGLPCNLDCDDFALFDSDGKPILDANGKQVTENPVEQTNTLIGGELDPTELEKVQSRLIENVDIDNGYLKLTTEGDNRQTVAQISVESLKRAIDDASAASSTTTTKTTL